MRVRAMDANGDMTFGQSQQNFLANTPAAVAQIVETTLRMWLGEWYLDTTAGTPWEQGVLGYQSQQTADQTLIQVITGVENVLSLNNWSSVINPETRTYTSIKAILYTTFGETPLEVDFSGDF